jgi:hypothetical protein
MSTKVGKNMTRIVRSIAAGSAILCLGGPSQAGTYGHAPWCALMETGGGAVDRECLYATVDECYPNVLGGNRGVCVRNPYWVPPPPVPYHRHHVRRGAPPG